MYREDKVAHDFWNNTHFFFLILKDESTKSPLQVNGL